MSTQYINEPATEGKVCLHTSVGDIDIELWSKEAPKACRNFVQLCLEGYYNKCKFHTVIKDCITQTGDPTNTGEGGESVYERDFKVETHQRLKFNRRGLVAMAANQDGYLASQFFITLGSTPELNGKHTLFGKIANQTVFNIMKLNEYEVDSDNKPIRSELIKRVEVLNNPFNDIVLREIKSKEKKHRKSKKDKKLLSHNVGLLSFGDEHNEEELVSFNKKLKGKSAHDVLKDDKLSKEVAVKPEELGDYMDNGDEDEDGGESLNKVRERLKSGKRKREVKKEEDDPEVDFDGALDDVDKAKKDAEREALMAESKRLQKEYAKSLRGPKAQKVAEDTTTDTMKEYNKMKLKYKSKHDNVVKELDKKREQQTMMLVNRFKNNLNKETSSKMLNNKKIDMAGQKTQAELLKEGTEAAPKRRFDDKMDIDEENEGEATLLEVGEEVPSTEVKIDQDATDIKGSEWITHKFVAPEDKSGMTKARDANLREEDEEWYDISDPRNKMNQRKREQI
ncbi:unnamed protein product [Bursaphelenchus okinawaensis]|uniref:Spliceosome-associated protein CWC27 homolog n=1 Tax=Bursaphelenchus okinawaensis TaxID=465554 RepID=A0A811K8N8_9BILA|nr:unnamed protein product [Bursaphelenchus okinawaensis]CAG9094064.1 unnamed protein product [Bursaphelenchus okinawaensis]